MAELDLFRLICKTLMWSRGSVLVDGGTAIVRVPPWVGAEMSSVLLEEASLAGAELPCEVGLYPRHVVRAFEDQDVVVVLLVNVGANGVVVHYIYFPSVIYSA